jgi:hypothetical protein
VEILASEEVVFAEGANYRVVLLGRSVRLRVWRVPNLSSEEAAADFELLVERIVTLATSTAALMIDASAAPPVAGPRTQAALEKLFHAFASKKKRIAVIVSEHALQQLQMRRLLGEQTSPDNAIFTEVREAEKWIA